MSAGVSPLCTALSLAYRFSIDSTTQATESTSPWRSALLPSTVPTHLPSRFVKSNILSSASIQISSSDMFMCACARL